MNGVVVVDKPCGVTSHDVVDRLRRIYGTRKVGHAGTLDPLATGVLVVCIGQATRILEYLAATRKRYVAGVLFGVRTDSQDITGAELSRQETSNLVQGNVEAVLSRFRGPIRQIPPMHSAVHHEGKRLYELARKGIEVERQAREVEIFSLEMIGFTPGIQAHAELDVECSSGTYIRTLAADIGEAVGCGATMNSLHRTAVGSLNITEAFSLEELERRKSAGKLASTLQSISEALDDWPAITLSEAEHADVRHGMRLEIDSCPAGRVLLVDNRLRVVALANSDGNLVTPFKVLSQSE